MNFLFKLPTLEAFAPKVKAPPVLTVEIWKLFTDSKVEKHGEAVSLMLTGCTRDAVQELKAADVGKADSLR